jgi:hypothetical protein
MSQNSQQANKKWGVGSFFQQAVAGVESRLDHILMEEEASQNSSTAKPSDVQSGEASAKKTPVARTNSLI